MSLLRGVGRAGGCGCGMGADTPIPAGELEDAAKLAIELGGRQVNTSVWALLVAVAAMWWLGTQRSKGGA